MVPGADAAPSPCACILLLSTGQHVTHRRTPSCSQCSVPPQPVHGGGSTVAGGTALLVPCAHDGYAGAMTSLRGTDDGYDRDDGWMASSLRGTSPPCEGTPEGPGGGRGQERSCTNLSHASHPSWTGIAAVRGGVRGVMGGSAPVIRHGTSASLAVRKRRPWKREPYISSVCTTPSRRSWLSNRSRRRPVKRREERGFPPVSSTHAR